MGVLFFTLQPDGCLKWLDETEHAGEDFLFTKMGGFSGIWHCENISIDFYLTAAPVAVLFLKTTEIN